MPQWVSWVLRGYHGKSTETDFLTTGWWSMVVDLIAMGLTAVGLTVGFVDLPTMSLVNKFIVDLLIEDLAALDLVMDLMDLDDVNLQCQAVDFVGQAALKHVAQVAVCLAESGLCVSCHT